MHIHEGKIAKSFMPLGTTPSFVTSREGIKLQAVQRTAWRFSVLEKYLKKNAPCIFMREKYLLNTEKIIGKHHFWKYII